VSPALWAQCAWLGDGPGTEAGFADHVLIEHSAAGEITSVRSGVAPPGDAAVTRLGGWVLPGFVNAHSHAFHRALRGMSETRAGDFWTWRELMYSVASRLEPESYAALAEAVYAEMLLAGYTSVGEFHYLHHQSGGEPYRDDPNAMGKALLGAAARAGIRMTLIDACYLQAGADGTPLRGVQRRFGDTSGESWAARVSTLWESGLFGNEEDEAPPADLPRLGVAVHSVRAVPPGAIRTVAAFAAFGGLPLHVHLSEQRAENEACLKMFSKTPADLLASCEALSPRTTAVHATHLTPADIASLGLAGCGVCCCPTTERDLGDGVGPFLELAEAGAHLSVGSDSHAVIDPIEECRAVELNQRLSRERRGLHRVRELLDAGTSGGAGALGWPAGGLSVGSMADLVAIRTDSARIAGAWSSRASGEAGSGEAASSEAGCGEAGSGKAGSGKAGSGEAISGVRNGTATAARTAGESEAMLAAVLFGAGAGDVETVVVGGRVVVSGGAHVQSGTQADVGAMLNRAISRLLKDAP
jgi:formiminoglutamate deiminase